jgi:three-Cys-motif partner protein
MTERRTTKPQTFNPQTPEPHTPAPLPFPDPLPPKPQPQKTIKRLRHPVWTENKAKLIERYLYKFVMVTKHGTYIDGFAGPQNPKDDSMWSAKLVLESEPRWLKFFYLFDILDEQVARLEALKEQQPERDSKGRKIYRTITVKGGDFNETIHGLLKLRSIKPTEATFCLLDQRSTECHWSTVQALAEYKADSPHKIELFYFLAVGWLGRTMAATTQNTQDLDDWWGGPGWRELKGKSCWELSEIVAERFRSELNYKTAMAWPIFEREGGGKVMYFMIHATDHDEAPALMYRSYDQVHQPKEPLPNDLFEWRLPPAATVQKKLKRIVEAAKREDDNC